MKWEFKQMNNPKNRSGKKQVRVCVATDNGFHLGIGNRKYLVDVFDRASEREREFFARNPPTIIDGDMI